MTVNEVSKRTGVSIRTLQYYDKIGLLKATAYTPSGYRQYDEAALGILQQILLYRELEFSLKDIQRILNSPDYDRTKAIRQQITLLEMKLAHTQALIAFAHALIQEGDKNMEFSAFDRSKMDAYAREAKASWGNTPAYREFAEKDKHRTREDNSALGQQLMAILAVFGTYQDRALNDPAVTAQVEALQRFITEHYYTCSNVILAQLGQMYGDGGEFTQNINAAGGPGTAEFASRAIAAYCEERA